CVRTGSFGARFLTVAFLPVWLNILELPFPQISQPISNLCGLLEFHLLGRMTHIGLELLDRFLQLLRRILFEFVQLQRHLEIICLICRDERGVDRLYDRLWRDAVLAIIFLLQTTPAGGFLDGILHRFGDLVGIEYRHTLLIARSPAYS